MHLRQIKKTLCVIFDIRWKQAQNCRNALNGNPHLVIMYKKKLNNIVIKQQKTL